MTFRSVILGLLGAIVIAAVGYLNDQLFYGNLPPFVGNHFPISVFGFLFLFVLTINPLLFIVRPAWRLASSELAVMVTLMLVACSIPGAGLMRAFTTVLAMPTRIGASDVGWREAKVLEYVPPQMVANGGKMGAPIEDFFTGKTSVKEFIPFSDVPWDAWAGALQTWAPMILLLAIATICLSLIVHRQWGYRERLRYPIAEVAKSIIGEDPARPFSKLLRNKLFWAALLTILTIHLINGFNVWSQGQSISIPLQFKLDAIGQKFPQIAKAEGSIYLLRPTIFPTVVAFSMFLASDVSLSLGLSMVVSVAMFIGLTSAGHDISYDWGVGGPAGFQRFGSYLAVAMLLLYMGRRYYWDVARNALAPWTRLRVEPVAVWALRILIVALAGLTILLTQLGVAWPIAALFVVLTMLMFVVLARISAESGLFFVQSWWHPAAVLLALFGATALGPTALLVMMLFTVVLAIDPRESLMPFFVNGLKLCDDQKVKPSRVGWAGALAFGVALTVAVPIALWANYSFGINRNDTWNTRNLPRLPYDTTSGVITKLKNSGELQQALSLTDLKRLTQMKPDANFLWAAGLGVALVLVVSFLRLRFTWWPLHPILFLVWGTFPIWQFSVSFLLGWFIKMAVTRLGGAQKYREILPLMIGVIAGDLLGGLFWMIHGGLYFALRHVPPPHTYQIFPS